MKLYIRCPSCNSDVMFCRFNQHMRAHKNVCPFCNVAFKNNIGLMIHLRNGDLQHKVLWSFAATKQGKSLSTRRSISEMRRKALELNLVSVR